MQLHRLGVISDHDGEGCRSAGAEPGTRLLAAGPAPSGLPTGLRALLDRLGSGPATPAALLRDGDDVDGLVAGLAELELLGFVARAPGGAYVRAAGVGA